ncbi:MAG: 2-phospho-L-lactate guanylyltransferase [Alphaproteobacteria bacterium]|jgi:2-phospho-L-lactate guanylyltransferase|nr:2-phospho-L-lactate guanylyltransferase [Alphaproteobacteria bacterium]
MWAVVPIKGFEAPKRRLATILSPAERGRLAAQMMQDVLATLTGLIGVMVVSGDARVLEMADGLGARAETERWPMGYSTAVRQAAETLASEGVGAMMHVPGDVPLITTDEVAQVAAAHQAAPAVTVVPSRDRDGTNCLALSPPTLLRPAFGADSFERHCALARQAGVEPTVLSLPGFALDIDTPADLRLFCQRAGDGRSLRYLTEAGIVERING